MSEMTDTGGGFLQGVDPPTPPIPPETFDPQPQTPATIAPEPGQIPPGYFSQAEVEARLEQVRKEEKDKLYPRIDKLQEDMRSIQAEREERERAAHEAQESAEAERKAKEEEQMETRALLDRKDQEWQARFEQIEQERQAEKALLEQERRFNAVQEYRRNRIEQEADNIMPALRDLVSGSTEEEIEASIATLRDKSAAIFAEAVQELGQVPPPQPMRATGITAPPVGPLEQENGQRTFTSQDIRNMTPQEYAKHREGLLNAAGNQYRGY